MTATPSKLDAVTAHKKACAAIAVADVCISKAAHELQAIETQKKANATKVAQVLDIIKKAELIDINNPAEVTDMQAKLASHSGALDVAIDAIDNIVKLAAELDARDKAGHLNAPPPVQPAGGKTASLGSPSALPGGTAPGGNTAGDYNQQSQSVKRAADEEYLKRSGITPKRK